MSVMLGITIICCTAIICATLINIYGNNNELNEEEKNNGK